MKLARNSETCDVMNVVEVKDPQLPPTYKGSKQERFKTLLGIAVMPCFVRFACHGACHQVRKQRVLRCRNRGTANHLAVHVLEFVTLLVGIYENVEHNDEVGQQGVSTTSADTSMERSATLSPSMKQDVDVVW
eukprot:6479407-Amphidinium_carterae.1